MSKDEKFQQSSKKCLKVQKCEEKKPIKWPKDAKSFRFFLKAKKYQKSVWKCQKVEKKCGSHDQEGPSTKMGLRKGDFMDRYIALSGSYNKKGP